MEKETEKSLRYNKPFTFLMSAQLISNLGDWLSIMAIFSLMAFKWNATPLEMAFVIISLGLPMTVLGPMSGVIADRLNRKVIMVACDLFRCLLVLGFIFASVPWHVYVLLLLLGIFSSLFTPSKSGVLKEIVPDENMQNAASISSIIQDATKIIGPAISGFLVTAAGIHSVFIIDSASFFLSALFIFMLPRTHQSQSEKDHTKSSFLKDLQEGFDYMKKVPFILFGTGLMFISMLILQLADAQFTVLIRSLDSGTPALVGMVVTASGTGFLVMGVLLTKWQITSPWKAMSLGIFSLGAGFAVMGYLASIQLPHPFLWGPGITFLASSGAGMIFIPFNAAVQRLTPVHLTGRVFGLIGSIIMLATLIGPVSGGIAGNHFGVITVFIVSGAGLVTISIVSLLMKKTIERSEKHVTESTNGTQRTTSA